VISANLPLPPVLALARSLTSAHRARFGRRTFRCFPCRGRPAPPGLSLPEL
jgi:hypothetical protein